MRSGGRYTLLPPSAPRDLIAFAVNLLYAFDTHSVSLGEFLDEYYYSGNGVSFAFAAFAKNIVTPLADCVEKELRAFSSAAREESAAEPETVSEVEPLLPDEAERWAEAVLAVRKLYGALENMPPDIFIDCTYKDKILLRNTGAGEKEEKKAEGAKK